MRRMDPTNRGKIIQIDTRLSVTAAKANKWIPINPGTEGLLALGICYVLLKEELYNGFYLGDHSIGFSNFKNFILENYSDDTISRLTGVSIDTILQLAREFATVKPALAISGRIDIKDQIAIHLLNALVGSINVPGGVLIPQKPDYQPSHPVERDEISQEGNSKGKTSLLSGNPYSLSALFLYYTNPLFSNPQPSLIQDALKKIPFLVSFSPFMDETTAFCDLILPDHHFLERHQDVPTSTMQGFPLVGYSQPVRPSLYETRHTGDVILQLASGIGDSVDKSFPWKNFNDFLQEGFQRLYDSKKGDIFGTHFEAAWTSLLSRGGWWSPSYSSFKEFQKGLEEKGGWWNPIYFYEEWTRIFPNKTAKFEFPTLKDLPLVMPKGLKEFPLFLNAFPLMALTGGTETWYRREG
jgi:anaerobic selenocysteine-containing dehydrogenase